MGLEQLLPYHPGSEPVLGAMELPPNDFPPYDPSVEPPAPHAAGTTVSAHEDLDNTRGEPDEPDAGVHDALQDFDMTGHHDPHEMPGSHDIMRHNDDTSFHHKEPGHDASDRHADHDLDDTDLNFHG
jgi:hypothetical protein